MKLVILAALLGVAFSAGYGYLDENKAWAEEIIFDWENVDHVIAFDNWKMTFEKKYSNVEEETHRFLVFLDNWKKVNDFNIAHEFNYTMKLNQFGDLTGDEFRHYVHGHGDSCLKTRPAYKRVKMEQYTPKGPAATSIDWTNVNGKSYVTPIKNQGQCGSCWAFSATGCTESQSAIKNSVTGSSITELSEQQLVDCSSSEGNMGCNGGLMDYAFKYIESDKGLCSETEYPYKGVDGKCNSAGCGTKYYPISGYKDVTADSMTSLESAVAMGPTSIAIEADQSAFQFYSSGILNGQCGTRLDHGVLAVGYGSQGSNQYWKVKNSWGTSWGMEGYVLICKDCNKNGKEGECGILMEPSYDDAM